MLSEFFQMFLPSCINKHTFRYALLHVHRCIFHHFPLSLCESLCFSLLGSVSVCIIEVDCVSQLPGLSFARRQTSLSLSERCTSSSLQAAIGADGHHDTPLFRVCKILTYASNRLLSPSCVPFYACDGRQCSAVC